MGTTLDGIDLVNPDNYVERVPFEWFDELRHERPVSWHDEPGGNKGFWAVTRYDDLTAVHMDWQTYSSETGAVALEELDDEQLEVRKTMLEMDPPRHTDLRKICTKKFSGRGVAVYEDFIRDVARSVLDRALPTGEFDFVSEISRELPIRFLCSIFTVPQEDAPELIRWGDKMIANQDPELSDAVPDQVDTEAYRLLPFRSPAAYEVWAYADRQKELRRQGADRRRHLRAHVGAERGTPERPRVPQLLLVADDRRQRNDAAHHHRRHAGPDAGPGTDAAVEGRPVADLQRDRGDPALGDARAPFPADGDARRRAARAADQSGRQGGHVVHQREPRRGGLRRSLPLRRDAQAERPRHVRPRRAALLSGRAPRAPGNQDPVPGAAAAPGRRSSSPGRSSGSARTS